MSCLHAKSEVENCLAYLKEKRKGDPTGIYYPGYYFIGLHIALQQKFLHLTFDYTLH